MVITLSTGKLFRKVSARAGSRPCRYHVTNKARYARVAVQNSAREFNTL